MAVKKVKSASKIFVSDPNKITKIVSSTMGEISDIVGSTLGPSGRVCLLESEYFGIPNTNTKDGVTVFKSLGAEDPFKQIIIEQMRSAAIRTATEAGDGTTTSTILSTALVKNLLAFCNKNRRFSPQKAVRLIKKLKNEVIIPYIHNKSIKIDGENLEILRKVATISANGDTEMADAVIESFEMTGFTTNSHVTIQELSGPGGYSVELIDGFPINIGFEESIGKFHTAFINDQGNLRCVMEKPLFLLFDGTVSDIVQFQSIFEKLGNEYVSGNSDFRNIVFVSHGFNESVITQLAINFANPGTINILPVVTPMDQVKNARFDFMNDLAAFTGAKVFGMHSPIRDAMPEDFGRNMTQFECYRFRSTVTGEPDAMDIETRAEVLKKQLESPESLYAEIALKERLGKLTSGISKLKIYAGSSGELKELSARVEDAVMSVRAAISNGALPGGGRVLLNLSMIMDAAEGFSDDEAIVAKEIVAPSLMKPLMKLLDNAGYSEEETREVIKTLAVDENIVYDVSENVFGDAIELGLLDATKAVEQSIENSVSIASVMGTLGGLVVFPRDHQLEREEASADAQFKRDVEMGSLISNDDRI